MTVTSAFVAIFSQLVNAKTAPYVATIFALVLLSFLWRYKARSKRQHQIVAVALLLWLVVPASVTAGALFHYSGPDNLRGVAFNEPAAIFIGAMFPLALIGTIILLAIGKGVRLNVAISGALLLFAQSCVLLISGCAVVGVCV
jgi:uncharacterized membrane protein